MNDFEEYIKQNEPHKREKGYVWQTAIGLQAVDGLKPSEYLIETARRNIEGDITIDEARQLIKNYYESKGDRVNDADDTEEADKVSANIAKLLSERTFAFTVAGFIAIHRRIFDGVLNLQEKFGTIILLKKNGSFEVIRCYMFPLQIFVRPWNMILNKRKGLTIPV